MYPLILIITTIAAASAWWNTADLHPRISNLEIETASIETTLRETNSAVDSLLSTPQASLPAQTGGGQAVTVDSTGSPQEETFGAVNLVGGIPYYLYGSGVVASDTSITLTDFDTPVSGYNLTMSSFGDTGYLTLEPGNTTRQEFVSFTGVTQNSDDSATLTGVTRGLSPISPFTASTTLRKAHPGGSVAVLSDPPQLFNLFPKKADDETISGAWAATSYPTASTSIATKGYIDSIALGGSTNIDTVIVAGTAGETVASGEILYFDTIQDEWMKADASVTASSTQVLLGVAQGAGTNGSAVSGGVLLLGLDTKNAGGTAGNAIYISDTAGATSTSAGTVSKQIGIMRNSTTFYFNPYFGLPDLGVTQTWSGLNTFTATSTFSGVNAGFEVTATSSAIIGDFPAWQIGKFQQVFTGSGTFTVPSGITRVHLTAVGAGGGGAAEATGGGGGAGGAYCDGFVDVSATSSIGVTVGAGGAAGVAGGNSLFSSYVTAAGGATGSGANGGAGGDCTLGSGVANFLEIEDFNGIAGTDVGGSGDDYHGDGGGSVFGKGGQAGEDNATASSPGRQGTGYGAGGGGGNSTGGAGVGGVLIVRW